MIMNKKGSGIQSYFNNASVVPGEILENNITFFHCIAEHLQSEEVKSSGMVRFDVANNSLFVKDWTESTKTVARLYLQSVLQIQASGFEVLYNWGQVLQNSSK